MLEIFKALRPTEDLGVLEEEVREGGWRLERAVGRTQEAWSACRQGVARLPEAFRLL